MERYAPSIHDRVEHVPVSIVGVDTGVEILAHSSNVLHEAPGIRPCLIRPCWSRPVWEPGGSSVGGSVSEAATFRRRLPERPGFLATSGRAVRPSKVRLSRFVVSRRAYFETLSIEPRTWGIGSRPIWDQTPDCRVVQPAMPGALTLDPVAPGGVREDSQSSPELLREVVVEPF